MPREHTVLLLDTLGCAAAHDVAAALARAPGVVRIHLELSCEAIYVEYDSELLGAGEIERLVAEYALVAAPAHTRPRPESGGPGSKKAS